MGESIWQSMERKGYSRREFLQFCAAAATVAGLGQSGVAQVVAAFEKKERPTVVWMHFQECRGCSESFMRASHPIVLDALLEVMALNCSETLRAAPGLGAEKSLSEMIRSHQGKYIVLVEGAMPSTEDGEYCMIGGKTAESMLQAVAADAAAIVAWGSCASNGCAPGAKPNPTGATPIHKLVNKPVIHVPGCPPIADVMMGVVTHLLVLGQVPALDNQSRPKEFYGRRMHDASAAVKWNEGARYPMQPGPGNTGCREEGIRDNGPLYEHLASFPGFVLESTADTMVGAATVAGVAAHSIFANILQQSVMAEARAEEQRAC